MNSAREAISEGSKSFFLASLMFPKPVRQDVWTLYRWCRYCDDQVDLAVHHESAKAALDVLRARTFAALHGERGDPLFSDLGEICTSYKIESKYPLELLEGFGKDARLTQFDTLEEVEKYSYQVAGVVGVMMTSIIGGRDGKALEFAVALGNAMQLTNIARDVNEDFRRGRIYLPGDWLKEEKIPSSELMNAEHREAVYRTVLKLLDRAELLYAQGFLGLKYLPFRSAFAVASAAEIYRRIGGKIRRGGKDSIDQRVYVTLPEKLVLVLKGFGKALWSRL